MGEARPRSCSRWLLLATEGPTAAGLYGSGELTGCPPAPETPLVLLESLLGTLPGKRISVPSDKSPRVPVQSMIRQCVRNNVLTNLRLQEELP